MTSNPAFVIVPGVSHTPIFFQSVVDLLNRRGYQAKTVAYPTVGYNVSGTTYNDEVKSIQDAVAHYVENQHTDVILVCHSYGGWPGSRAVKGWDKTTREQLGLQNGIIELVFLAAFLIPDNAPMAAFSVLPDWLSNNTVENTRIPNEKAIPILFSDLNPAAQQYWFSKLEPQENDFTAPTIPNAPWSLSLPKTYIMTTNDGAVPFSMQFMGLQGVIDSTWNLKSIRSGHEPFLSQPENLVEVILSKTF